MGWKLVIIDKIVWFKHEIGWFIDDNWVCYAPCKWGHPNLINLLIYINFNVGEDVGSIISVN